MIHFWGYCRYKESDNLIGWEFKKRSYPEPFWLVRASGPRFKTTGWLQGWSNEYQDLVGT